MSVSVVPLTSSNGLVTAPQINSLRDNLNWLKGALNVITANSAADTGNTTSVWPVGATSTFNSFATQVTGDSFARFMIYASGKMHWGAGSGAQDTFLERVSAAVLGMSGDTQMRNTWAAAASNIYFAGRASADTYNRVELGTDPSGYGRIRMGDGTATPTTMLSAAVAGTTLRTENNFDIGSGHIETGEIATPTNPGADRGRLFLKDNGAGKTQLCVIFSTGSAIVIATQV